MKIGAPLEAGVFVQLKRLQVLELFWLVKVIPEVKLAKSSLGSEASSNSTSSSARAAAASSNSTAQTLGAGHHTLGHSQPSAAWQQSLT